MSNACVRVSRGLLLHGPRLESEGGLTKQQFFELVGVRDTTFRSAAEVIGGREHSPGLRFFRASDRKIAFGPGAGLVLGVSVGAASLRAALVDANGELWNEHDAESLPDQLREDPAVVLDRIRDAAGAVLDPALKEGSLLVEGAIPLLGVAVAWPSAVDRQGKPAGHALTNNRWHGSQSLTQLVARHLGIDARRSHALNDCNAAAVAVSFERTRERDHAQQTNPELTLVLRLAGGIGGATIIVAPPRHDQSLGVTSGFLDSLLIGGTDLLAGEIGHVSLPYSAIRALNERRPDGLDALAPVDCSCRESSESPIPSHLEAYTSVGTVTRRAAPTLSRSDALQDILANPERHTYSRALADVGALVGEALLNPIAWLNPATIVLTGSLAVPEVVNALDRRIADSHPVVTHPNIRCVEGSDAYTRVQGAGLAVLRQHVHRQLPSIVGGDKKTLPRRVKQLTVPHPALPWAT
jgi:predicted NBD/HSP70 family sugar kinase